MPTSDERQLHGARDAEERGKGICRTCLAPIWNEGGSELGVRRAEGWSDRIESGGDSLVCFKAIRYRHVPLTGREAAIYDHAAALAPIYDSAAGTTSALREALLAHHPIMRSETGPFSGCRCGQVKLGQDVLAHVLGHLRAALAPGTTRRQP